MVRSLRVAVRVSSSFHLTSPSFHAGERQHCLITRSYINISWHWHRAMAVRKINSKGRFSCKADVSYTRQKP
ncbi:hypothetical protein OUZ56_029314 [Daphnia magna]|uniref:Secreted protein n=1 Tax=Daphnia magna TaxID=35525 RepID=A0ABR0B6G4_9CRUS|nr:hypothetical protein OUZ56_029314 [Daphnia magna]